MNMFKRKHKRSEWLEGLIAGQNSVEEVGLSKTKWSVRDMEQHGYDYYLNGQWYAGYLDYLEHYENILQKL